MLNIIYPPADTIYIMIQRNILMFANKITIGNIDRLVW